MYPKLDEKRVTTFASLFNLNKHDARIILAVADA